MMKICFPIQYKPQGGAYTFAWNFRSYVDQHGIPFTDDLSEEYNILFVNSWVIPNDIIREVKLSRPTVRVVQRVDGSARDYGRYDDADEKQSRVNLLADLTIFQSYYSKYSSTQKYKVICEDGPIIHNPVDTHLFTPDGPRLDLPPGRIRVASASWSINRKKGTWQIDQLASDNPDIDFVLCGRYEGFMPRTNVHILGHLSREEIAIALRSCDFFVNLSENDPCPNVVLEALASGLPVLYKDSGGTPELVGDCGLAVTVNNFRQQLKAVLKRRNDLSKAARKRAVDQFAPDHIFPQYLAAMTRAKRRPLPSQWDFIQASLQGYPVLPYALRQLLWYAPHWLVRKLFAGAR